MKQNRTARIMIQNLIWFGLSFGLVALLGWHTPSIALQPAELIANTQSAQINVRSTPSTTAPRTGIAFPGDRVQVLNQTQSRDGFTWYQMQSNRSGIVGWVRGDLIRLLAAAPQPRLFVPQRTAVLQRTPIASPAANCASVYPVATPVINQGFGQVSDPTNPRQTHFHTGIDFDGAVGDPINSPVCGTVVYVGREQDGNNYEWGYGWHVKIRDTDGRIHLFAHISKAYVKVDQTVTPRQLIAAIGNNGNSTGPHLHYEIRQGGDTYQNSVNPMLFLVSAGQGGVQQAGIEVTQPRLPLQF